MADTGYQWNGDWSYVQKGAGDWNDDALADNATETSDAIDLAVATPFASVSIGITLVEDNTGAIDGVVTVYVLGVVGDDSGALVYQEPGIGNTWSFTITPVQNDTVQAKFQIDTRAYDYCKIAIKNESGQELAVTVEYSACNVPVAS